MDSSSLGRPESNAKGAVTPIERAAVADAKGSAETVCVSCEDAFGSAWPNETQTSSDRLVHMTSHPMDDWAGCEKRVSNSAEANPPIDRVPSGRVVNAIYVVFVLKTRPTSKAIANTVLVLIWFLDGGLEKRLGRRGSMMRVCIVSRFGRKVCSDVNGEIMMVPKETNTQSTRAKGALVRRMLEGRPEEMLCEGARDKARKNRFVATLIATSCPKTIYAHTRLTEL